MANFYWRIFFCLLIYVFSEESIAIHIGVEGGYSFKHKIANSLSNVEAVPAAAGRPQIPASPEVKYVTKSEPIALIYTGSNFYNLYQIDLQIAAIHPSETFFPVTKTDEQTGEVTLTGEKAYLKHNSIYSMLNLKYFVPSYDYFKVFADFGIGIGYSNCYNYQLFDKDNKLLSKLSDYFKTNMIWQVGCGIELAINQNMYLDFGLRHLSLGKIRTGDELIEDDKVKTKNDANIVYFNKVKSNQFYIGFRLAI